MTYFPSLRHSCRHAALSRRLSGRRFEHGPYSRRTPLTYTRTTRDTTEGICGMMDESDYERAHAAALRMMENGGLIPRMRLLEERRAMLERMRLLEERCAMLEEQCATLERQARAGFSTYRDEASDAREDADGWQRSALAKDDALGAIREQVQIMEAALERAREALDEGELS